MSKTGMDEHTAYGITINGKLHYTIYRSYYDAQEDVAKALKQHMAMMSDFEADAGFTIKIVDILITEDEMEDVSPELLEIDAACDWYIEEGQIKASYGEPGKVTETGEPYDPWPVSRGGRQQYARQQEAEIPRQKHKVPSGRVLAEHPITPTEMDWDGSKAFARLQEASHTIGGDSDQDDQAGWGS